MQGFTPFHIYAAMAELADALDSGSSLGNKVEVQVLLAAPNAHNPNHQRQVQPVGEGLGFVLFLAEKWEDRLLCLPSHFLFTPVQSLMQYALALDPFREQRVRSRR